jgi:hypothetical protein
VLVLDPDRTQLESTAEFLMRFLPGRQAPQLCLAVEASNGIVLRPGGLGQEVGNFCTINNRFPVARNTGMFRGRSWHFDRRGNAKVPAPSTNIPLYETFWMFATIYQWANQTSPTTAD